MTVKGLQSAARIICSLKANKFHTCRPRSVFCDVHAAAKNGLHLICRLRAANSARLFRQAEPPAFAGGCSACRKRGRCFSLSVGCADSSPKGRARTDEECRNPPSRPAEGSGPYEMSADDGNTVVPVWLAAFLKSKKTPLRCEPEGSILLTDG